MRIWGVRLSVWIGWLLLVLATAGADGRGSRSKKKHRTHASKRVKATKRSKARVVRMKRPVRYVAPALPTPVAATSNFQLTDPQAAVEVFAPNAAPANRWVDSVFTTLTPEQKVGQFFMVAAYSNRGEGHQQYLAHLIQNYHIGGLIFFQGGPYRQAILTNRFQAMSKLPLLIGIDGEWGLGMRLDSTMDFPKQMTLGAIQDDRLIYRMGAEIARQCSRLGIHINFAPVSDVNTNPTNPVIGLRSFGESRENVAAKASAYMRGLQNNRVIATAKHFPGHGDASADSHHTLPRIGRSPDQLRETDLYPFRKLIADSLMGMVTGHLYVPAIDNASPAIAATLSEKVVTDLLKRDLGFRGLVFTDAMNMGGLVRAGRTRATDVNLRALLAGNDILLYPENIKDATQAILSAVEQGTLSQELVDEKVKKILRAKYWAGLHQRQPIALRNLDADLNSPDARQLRAELCAAAVTVVRNEKKLLPLQRLDTVRLASIAIGSDSGNVFQQTVARFAPARNVAFGRDFAETDVLPALMRVADANVVLVSLHGLTANKFRNYGIPTGTLSLLRGLKEQGKRVVVSVFGSAYSLGQLPGADALVCGYQELDEMQQATAQALFGAERAAGVLPVTVGTYRAGLGLTTIPSGRLSAGTPESVGMKSATLAKIDEMAQQAVRNKVVPGCQILVARQGKIVYHKNFGRLTYDPAGEKVTDATLYDLASVTKVLSTLQAVMLLYDRRQLDLTQKASVYLPELRGTNKQNITIQDLLWHQSGLIAFYPTLWDRTRLPGGALNPKYYADRPDSLHTLQIAPKLWAVTAIKDSVWKWVVQSPLSTKRDASGQPPYVYSDLGFLTLQKVVERITRQPLDKYIDSLLYRPMGLTSLGFTPLQRFVAPHCAPTEQDTYYRHQLLVGTVHDQMAAVQGGVSGHAGLFGNALDVAKVLQMNLQRGEYGGERFLLPATVPFFSQTISSRSYRALGWDKPNPDSPSSVYLAPQAGPRSFGHTGFTGNMVWVDPDEQLVFVFLSNRLYPTGGNTAINTTKLRRRIDEVVYNAIDRTADR